MHTQHTYTQHTYTHTYMHIQTQTHNTHIHTRTTHKTHSLQQSAGYILQNMHTNKLYQTSNAKIHNIINEPGQLSQVYRHRTCLTQSLIFCYIASQLAIIMQCMEQCMDATVVQELWAQHGYYTVLVKFNKGQLATSQSWG